MLFVTLFTAANVLFCMAYLVRDMAWLRTITIVAAGCTLPYFYFQPAPLYSAMAWQLAFIAINGVNLTRLLLERRPVPLTETEQQLHNLTFRTMTPREMLRVLEFASWHEAPAGSQLITQGEQIERLLLIHSGRAEVLADYRFRANLGPGDFMGEMGFATGRPTSADVVTTEDTRFLSWQRSDLERLYRRQPELKDAMLTILGTDMAQKLSR
jgi:hypothetical protein